MANTVGEETEELARRLSQLKAALGSARLDRGRPAIKASPAVAPQSLDQSEVDSQRTDMLAKDA